MSCKQEIVPADIQKINGYWEIVRVDIPDLEHKEYRMNEVFDYFEIKNNSGFRKKVMPQLDGTFLANDVSENVSVVFKDKKTFLKFKTQFTTWQEELTELRDSTMVLVNDKKIVYKYKKTGPINILNDGKTSK